MNRKQRTIQNLTQTLETLKAISADEQQVNAVRQSLLAELMPAPERTQADNSAAEHRRRLLTMKDPEQS